MKKSSSYHPDITAYIERAEPFAQPILSYIREIVHEFCPEVEEKMKWSFPHFDYLGEMMCSMAAFKKHCAFGFWKATLLETSFLQMGGNNKTAMGDFGKLTKMEDLPPKKILSQLILAAKSLNDEGIKIQKKPSKGEQKEIATPEDFQRLLSEKPAALSIFEKFPYSHRKEYIQWFDEAKTSATRLKRMVQALEWISQGKGRNWKYQKK